MWQGLQETKNLNQEEKEPKKISVLSISIVIKHLVVEKSGQSPHRSPLNVVKAGGKRNHPHMGEEIVINAQNSLFKDTGSPTSDFIEPNLPKFTGMLSSDRHQDLLAKLTENIHVSEIVKVLRE